MKVYFSLLLSLLLCAACTKRATVASEALGPSKAETHFADLLQMQEFEEGRVLCRILDPWRTENVVAQYLLVPRDDQHWNDAMLQTYDETYGTSTLLRTPLQHMTITSGCHAWLLNELNAMDCVAVMCDSGYVMSPAVKLWLRTHDVKDGGSSMSPNQEVMMQSMSDAVWISPFENAGSSQLQQLPIPIIYCADYMENSPLGRAEWMKFYGRLAGKGQEADSLFRLVSFQYDSIAHSVAHTGTKASLLAELPYGATWYVPGGRSTSALLYQDAGFSYPWTEDTHSGSLSLSMEAVLAKAGECDVWYFKYMNADSDWTYEDFIQQNPLYAQFHATKEKELWGCNTAVSDFFDVTPFRPDLLLESMITKDEKFYKRLK